MSNAEDEIEFRNREQELEQLLERIPPQATHSTITFIRAPSGYGKTRLVDQVQERLPPGKPRCIVVEPEIRTRHQSGRVYAWYFVQRAASAISADQNVSFARFLKRQRLRRIHWRNIYETGKEAFSIAKTIKMVIELVENIFGKNRFHPDALLKDESSFATGLTKDYVAWLTKLDSTLLLVRETQLIDIESFRFFLNLHKSTPNVFFIFEYTADSEFFSEHQKVLEECRSTGSNIRIVDLVRLNQKEFLFLLKKYVNDDIEFESFEFARWNGNLRLVRELKEQVYVERPFDGAYRAEPFASDLRVLIHDRIERLGNLEKLILANVVCHVEAVPILVLKAAISKSNASTDQAEFQRAIIGLVSGARYLRSDSVRLAIGDEDVASVIADSPSFSRFRALAERSLREVYLASLAGDRAVSIPLPLAFRQSIALCLSTGDAAAVRRLIRMLVGGARGAHDQSMYVNLVADALFGHFGNGGTSNSELFDWAAASAYEIGDYQLASELIEASPSIDMFDECLLAFCYGETNRHSLALEIGSSLGSSLDETSASGLLGRLIQIANLFALGRKTEAAKIHAEMRANSLISDSPLFGYVLRFTELLQNFPDCTSDVLCSVDHFRNHHLSASAAYSALSGAMHLAYAGDISRASDLVNQAKIYLKREVRDLHVLFNNEVVVNLLSDVSDFNACMMMLDHAAYGVRDEFYRAVIENNRLICRWQLGQMEDAMLSVSLLEEVMRAPGFGNRDVFWTFTYNCWAFLQEIGDEARANALLRQLDQVKVEQLDYEDYWLFRFKKGVHPSAEYEHLLKFRYHPEYLSHWLIDLDAIRAAKKESLL